MFVLRVSWTKFVKFKFCYYFHFCIFVLFVLFIAVEIWSLKSFNCIVNLSEFRIQVITILRVFFVRKKKNREIFFWAKKTEKYLSPINIEKEIQDKNSLLVNVKIMIGNIIFNAIYSFLIHLNFINSKSHFHL